MEPLDILYVEDDPRSQKVMKILIGRLGTARLTLYEDSQDFLARVVALDPKPAVIFLDIHVQPLNGFEMLKILRESPVFADTRIVALTASVMNEEVQQLQTAGFDGCLGKPINDDTFSDLLDRIKAGEQVWQILN